MVAAVFQTASEDRLKEARVVQAKLDRYCVSRCQAARLTAFWLYLKTFGAAAAASRFGSSYYRQNSELMKALLD